MRIDRLRQPANIIALIVVLVVNGLANTLPLNGQTTGEISNRFPIRFIPAGYAFGIWSLIYTGLLGYVIYQALPAQRKNPRLQRIGWWFVLSCVLNIAWLLAWHYNLFLLTVPLMFGLFATLFAIYIFIRMSGKGTTAVDDLLLFIPFSLYLGWITVATIVNTATVWYQQGWPNLGISAEIWAVLLLVVGVAIAALFARNKPDIAYIGVLIWAFVGIAVAQQDAPLVFIGALVAALASAVLLVLGLLGGGSRRRRRPRPAS